MVGDFAIFEILGVSFFLGVVWSRFDRCDEVDQSIATKRNKTARSTGAMWCQFMR